jgi:hypothetical protein
MQKAVNSWQITADSLQRIARSVQQIPAIAGIDLATCVLLLNTKIARNARYAATYSGYSTKSTLRG